MGVSAILEEAQITTHANCEAEVGWQQKSTILTTAYDCVVNNSLTMHLAYRKVLFLGVRLHEKRGTRLDHGDIRLRIPDENRDCTFLTLPLVS